MAWIFVNQTKFYLHDDETLLDGLIRQGYEPAYQCGEGYCGTCKIKRHANDKLDARIDFIHEPLAILEDNDILPCSCRVKGVLHIQLEALTTCSPQANTVSNCFDSDDLYEDVLFNS